MTGQPAPVTKPGPALTALTDRFPGMADDEAAISWAAAVDRAGCTEGDVSRAFDALDRATPKSDFDYWRTVLVKRMARDWPEVRAALEAVEA